MNVNVDTYNLFRALKPMRIIYSFVGCTYLTRLKRHQKRTRRIERLFAVITKIPAIILLIISVWGLPQCTRRHKTIQAATKFITGHLNVAVIANNVLFAFLNGKKLSNALAKFVTVDLQLQKISNTVISYKRSRRRIVMTLILCGCLQIIKILMDGFAVAAGILTLFCVAIYIFPYTSTLIVECYLIMLLTELRIRFQTLNAHISGVIDVSYGKTLPINRFRLLVTNSSKENFVKSSKLHSELCEIGKMINRSFEAQILVINVTSFVHIVSSCFYLAEVVDKTHYFKDLSNYFYLLYWIATHVTGIFVIFYSFTSVAAEARKTASILHSRKFLNAKINYSNLMVVFTKQLYFQNTKFSVYQLYPLDWTALFFILTNVFTFLIILLQFNSIVINESSI